MNKGPLSFKCIHYGNIHCQFKVGSQINGFVSILFSRSIKLFLSFSFLFPLVTTNLAVAKLLQKALKCDNGLCSNTDYIVQLLDKCLKYLLTAVSLPAMNNYYKFLTRHDYSFSDLN